MALKRQELFDYGKLLVDAMDDKIKHGTIFIHEDSVHKLILIYTVFLMIFAAFWFGFEFFFKILDWKFYTKKTHQDRLTFMGLIMSNVHHFIVVGLNVRNLYNSCATGSEFPVEVEGVSKMRFMYSDLCFFQP